MPDFSLPDLPPNGAERLERSKVEFRREIVGMLSNAPADPSKDKSILRHQRDALAALVVSAAMKRFESVCRVYFPPNGKPLEFRYILNRIQTEVLGEVDAAWIELGGRYRLEWDELKQYPPSPVDMGRNDNPPVLIRDSIDVKLRAKDQLATLANELENDMFSQSVSRPGAEANGKPPDAHPRKSYRAEVEKWMKDKGIETKREAAKQLGVSESTLKSIMTTNGKPRYGRERLEIVLKKIAQPKV